MDTPTPNLHPPPAAARLACNAALVVLFAGAGTAAWLAELLAAGVLAVHPGTSASCSDRRRPGLWRGDRRELPGMAVRPLERAAAVGYETTRNSPGTVPMPRPEPIRRPSVAAWGAAALLAAAASAGPARATCGDYVHIGAPVAGSAADGAAADGAAPAPKPVAPCHGPGCTGHKAPAPVAPVAPAEPGPADAILTADPPADPDRPGRLDPPSPRLPAGPVAAIFHPPRHS